MPEPSGANSDVKILTKLLRKATDENHRKYSLLNQDELRAIDELVYTSTADSDVKNEFWGAAVDYRSKMVTLGKFH